MEIFLVPVAADRYELYCEAPIDHVAPPASAAPASWLRRQVDRFRGLLAEAEEDRRKRERGEPADSAGVWRWIMRKVAEAIAEQRLLWLLRRLAAASLIHPDDVSPAQALEIARRILRSDFERHRRWLAIDALLMVIFLPLTVIPGPNVPSLYFSFRAVGHYFSMMGARRARTALDWQLVSSRELAGVRQALGLASDARRARLEQIATSLGLDRLEAFVERVA